MITTRDYCPRQRRSCKDKTEDGSEDRSGEDRGTECPCDGECFMCGQFIAKGRMSEHMPRIHGMTEEEARQMQRDLNMFGYTN
ncbi:MAG: hypothetical protein WDZ61_00530 [Parcubacteria group bacterium]